MNANTSPNWPQQSIHLPPPTAPFPSAMPLPSEEMIIRASSPDSPRYSLAVNLPASSNYQALPIDSDYMPLPARYPQVDRNFPSTSTISSIQQKH